MTFDYNKSFNELQIEKCVNEIKNYDGGKPTGKQYQKELSAFLRKTPMNFNKVERKAGKEDIFECLWLPLRRARLDIGKCQTEAEIKFYKEYIELLWSSCTYSPYKLWLQPQFEIAGTTAHIKPFRVDFANVASKIAIEIDGGYHQERRKYDMHRDLEIKDAGWSIIRFTNEEVLSPKLYENPAHETLNEIEQRLWKHDWRRKCQY